MPNITLIVAVACGATAIFCYIRGHTWLAGVNVVFALLNFGLSS